MRACVRLMRVRSARCPTYRSSRSRSVRRLARVHSLVVFIYFFAGWLVGCSSEEMMRWWMGGGREEEGAEGGRTGTVEDGRSRPAENVSLSFSFSPAVNTAPWRSFSFSFSPITHLKRTRSVNRCAVPQSKRKGSSKESKRCVRGYRKCVGLGEKVGRASDSEMGSDTCPPSDARPSIPSLETTLTHKSLLDSTLKTTQ